MYILETMYDSIYAVLQFFAKYNCKTKTLFFYVYKA